MSTLTEDLTGKKFGMLTAARSAGKRGHNVYWYCDCKCGNTLAVSGSSLKRGLTKSCGCNRRAAIGEKNATHGLSKHPIYRTWINIIKRCNNKNSMGFEYYGGRGIKVCEEWEDVGVFIKWAEENGWEPGLQIDRINNDGNYCPENCRFTTCKENVNNSRIIKSSNTTGYRGVSFHKPTKKYRAYIGGDDVAFSNNTNGQKYLGLFNTPEEAAEARDRFIIENNLPYRKLQILKRP